MKINLKTIGAVAAACALPIAKSHAWPVMTPEQLKAALEAIRTESMTRTDFPFKIEKIEYASDGIPKSIEGINVTSEYIDTELLKRVESFSLNIKNKADLGKAGERLEAFSKELSAEDLEKRGVDINHLKTLGIENVREITFDSILKSDFFNNTQREKAKVWLENKEGLEKAIEDYANSYPYDLLYFQCDLLCKKDADNVYEHTVSCIIPRSEKEISAAKWRLRVGDTWRYEIAKSLKTMLLYKNGKEKVILLLLLDEATPKENRLKFGYDYDNINGSYQPNNCITSDILGEQFFFLSHEIGHYLQMHFGLVQTFKDYQGSQTQENKFAKKLLLLDNDYPQNPMPIPSEMREYVSMVNGSSFWLFDRDYFACPGQLSLNKIFAYVQLLIRWQSTAEISNILGVYFNGNTLYLNALSDIRELKRIRYTHNLKSFGNQILEKLGTLPKEIQTFLRNIFSQASQMPLPKDMLKLLCQLHQRKNPEKDAQNVVCEFDCNNDQEWKEKVKTLLSDFIKAE